MGIDAITRRDDGSSVTIPNSRDDRKMWVSAGRTRCWMTHDPLIDWLLLYGKDREYIPKQDLEGYKPDLDFIAFIFDQGRAFEEGILNLLKQRYDVITVAQDYRDILNLEKAMETWEMMRCGAPIIHQGVLWDAEHLNYGAPDCLVRSDVLLELFPETYAPSEALVPAPGLDSSRWHYRVVDTKFTTLHMNAKATELGNSGASQAYKAQLYVYNRMLGRLQGYEPPESYLLGRGWQYTAKGDTYRYPNAMDRLGPVSQNGTVANKVPIGVAVDQAMAWVRRVRDQGANWELLPEPSVRELYPNMSNHDDGDMMLDLANYAELEPGYEDDAGTGSSKWMGVKKWLAGELKELTLLWQVGVAKRELAHEDGFYRWDDPLLTPDAVGVSGPKMGPTLDRLLAVNASQDGPPVLPELIGATRSEWFVPSGLEFFVDFEFASDLNDDFSKLPAKGGQPLIFMIGCGHVENGQWKFGSWTADRMDEVEELRIIREWVRHMAEVRDRLDPGNERPRLYHWSPAEVTALESAYNSARNRHGKDADWPQLGWYDLLQNVFRAEPVVVRGALGFGLKAVANAMHDQGLIETSWESSQVDGLGAMVGAWRCDGEARQRGVPMDQLELMKEIIRYNEVDCRVMMEIVQYLRTRELPVAYLAT